MFRTGRSRCLLDGVTIGLPPGIDRRRELLFLPVDDVATAIDKIAGTVAQLFRLTTQGIAARALALTGFGEEEGE